MMEGVILSNVVSICQPPKFFTLEEADELVPLMLRITSAGERNIQKLLDDQRYMLRSGAPVERIKETDVKVGTILTEWGTKLTKLGCRVYGMGYVGLDSGSGFWSWHHGDGLKISYHHGYLETPLQRRKVVRGVKGEVLITEMFTK